MKGRQNQDHFHLKKKLQLVTKLKVLNKIKTKRKSIQTKTSGLVLRCSSILESYLRMPNILDFSLYHLADGKE